MGVEDVCAKCLPGQLTRELMDGVRSAHTMRLFSLETLLWDTAIYVAGLPTAATASVAETPRAR